MTLEPAQILRFSRVCASRLAALAAYVASAAQTASVQRRFYRFFQFVRLDGAHSARVVVELLGLAVPAIFALQAECAPLRVHNGLLCPTAYL